MFTLQTNFCLVEVGGGGVKSMSRGDCELQGGKLLKLLSQIRPRILPLFCLILELPCPHTLHANYLWGGWREGALGIRRYRHLRKQCFSNHFRKRKNESVRDIHISSMQEKAIRSLVGSDCWVWYCNCQCWGSGTGCADPHVFGPPGSGTGSVRHRYGSGSGSGSFRFLINVLSGLKLCLQNKILTQNFSKK